jgi:hypothetical protein
MFCYRCKKKLDLSNDKISFRSCCDFCGFDQHVCLNCKYYSIGKPNDCNVPNSERVLDKEKYNFCEDFKKKEKGDDKKLSFENIEKLFS